ncbi:MAG: pyridoxamine 5'-phosphate oxidase family protein [Deltaproteobacteria bacterium]|nr:pyridoxamine 5'-phosphate oxidase family protein [Deltaproteobacteria bacterium]
MSFDYSKFISDPKQVGILSTADSHGTPNCAVIGSAVTSDDNQLILALGDNRSLQNLQQNPQAVFIAFKEADFLPAWQGIRLYLKLEEIIYDGALKEQRVAEIKQSVGNHAAKMMVAAVRFSIYETRSLLDVSN